MISCSLSCHAVSRTWYRCARSTSQLCFCGTGISDCCWRPRAGQVTSFSSRTPRSSSSPGLPIPTGFPSGPSTSGTATSISLLSQKTAPTCHRTRPSSRRDPRCSSTLERLQNPQTSSLSWRETGCRRHLLYYLAPPGEAHDLRHESALQSHESTLKSNCAVTALVLPFVIRQDRPRFGARY